MRYLLFTVCFFITASSHAQNVASTTYEISYRRDCNWNSETHQFDKCGEQREYKCSFTLSADETNFVETIYDSKFTYDILDNDYDSATDETSYYVKDGNGHTQTFLIDRSKNAFAIMERENEDEISEDDAIVFLTITSTYTQ